MPVHYQKLVSATIILTSATSKSAWDKYRLIQRSRSGMMALRFFLGIFEAGFGPGIPYLLSFFYLRHEVGVRIAIFLSAAPLSTAFSGALAYG